MTAMGLGAAACLALAALAGGAHSAPSAVETGHGLANRYCSQCHVVAPGGRRGWTNAPNFEAIANRHGETAAKLSAIVQKPHMDMVNTARPPGEANAIAAYIMSLRKG